MHWDNLKLNFAQNFIFGPTVPPSFLTIKLGHFIANTVVFITYKHSSLKEYENEWKQGIIRYPEKSYQREPRHAVHRLTDVVHARRVGRRARLHARSSIRRRWRAGARRHLRVLKLPLPASPFVPFSCPVPLHIWPGWSNFHKQFVTSSLVKKTTPLSFPICEKIC